MGAVRFIVGLVSIALLHEIAHIIVYSLATGEICSDIYLIDLSLYSCVSSYNGVAWNALLAILMSLSIGIGILWYASQQIEPQWDLLTLGALVLVSYTYYGLVPGGRLQDGTLIRETFPIIGLTTIVSLFAIGMGILFLSIMEHRHDVFEIP